MSENKDLNSKEQEVGKKRKSRFGMVLGVLITILAVTFSFLALGQKENYTVLSSTSKEVMSKISKIKDYRTIKGYKVLEDNGKHKLVLISAGLTYDEFATIEVLDVKISKNKADVTVKENINTNPEREVVKYPFVVLKIESSVEKLVVKTSEGEEYAEIIIDGESVEKEPANEDLDNEEVEKETLEDTEDKEDKEEVKEDKEEEKEDSSQNSQSSENTKTLTCVYRGRVDSNSIEVSVGDSYRTFNVDMVQNAFVNTEIGETITVEYIESSLGQQIVKIK